MALTKADIETIQTVFGVKPEELSGALSSNDEVSLSLKLPGKVYKPEEVERLKTENQDIGIEIGYKKVAKAAGITLEAGEKDADTISSKLKSGIEKTLEEKYKNPNPSEELTKALQAKKEAEDKYQVLFGTQKKTKEELEAAKTNYSKLQTEIASEKRDNAILSHFPEKLGLDRADALLITKSILTSEVTEENGKEIQKHFVNGNLVTDNLGNPAPLENAVSEVIELKGWMKSSGKGGGDDKPPAGSMPDNLSDEKAMEYIRSQGVEPMSSKGSQMMLELTKNQK